jgi:NADPH-dependent 2,4-dienoyl-CoA reductase/sulfur reductase-like enzyme
MTLRPDRRAVIAGLASLAAMPSFAAGKSACVVVVGGGFGGATAARFVRRLAPEVNVTLVEPSRTFTSCPLSNLVIAGARDLAAQRFGYQALVREGIDVVHDRAVDVDAVARTVAVAGGAVLRYDRLILSPGIDMDWGALEGYEARAAETMPHAWKAGEQTLLLRRQLETMEDGGLVVISVPRAPFRCPPGPYERASLIAHYLTSSKPRSKVLVLDANDQFSKQSLFQAEWAVRYGDLLEWRGASDGGRVVRVDADAMTVETDFEQVRADVANVIPPQKAGEIAARAGVADPTGWCPVNAVAFESTLQPGIHVIGDATISAPMPKSAFTANLQAKVCAIQVVRLLRGMSPEPTVLANTCYSYLSPDAAISISGVYGNAGGVLADVPGAGGISPAAPDPQSRKAEAAQAFDWFRAITSESFG